MFGFIGNIGPWELVLVLLIALIIFGPGKLPEVAKGLGKAVNQFKNASSGLQKEFQDAIKDDTPPVQPNAAVIKAEAPEIVPEAKEEPKIETTTKTE